MPLFGFADRYRTFRDEAKPNREDAYLPLRSGLGEPLQPEVADS
jgi:hypothetical protein